MLIAVVEAIAEGERNKNFLVISPDSFEDYPSLNTWDKIEALEEKVINERLNGFDYRKHLAQDVYFRDVYNYAEGIKKYRTYMRRILK